MTKITLFISLIIFSLGVFSKETIKVGIYSYPPYSYSDPFKEGIIHKTVKILNEIQSDYDYKIINMSAKRRYRFFLEKKFDIMFFESIKWGWENFPILKSDPICIDEEVYIAKYSPKMKERIFDNIEEKRLALTLGFHYRLTDFESSEKTLRSKFDVIFSNDQSKNIDLILKDRAQISIVSRSFLKYYLNERPNQKDDLITHKEVDQTYVHRALVHKSSPIDIGVLNRHLKELRKHRDFKNILNNYDLKNIP